MKKNTIIGAFISIAVMALYGCGGGGGGGGTAPAPVAGSTTFSGVAAKGPINGGVVKVFNIKDGKVDRTAEIGSGTSDASGAFTVSIAPGKKPDGAVLVEVSGGTFNDEASGLAGVKLNVPLQAAVSSVVDGAKIAITPMTHLAVKQVEGIGTFSATEIDDANKQIGRFFEVDDIIKSQPFDPTKDAPGTASADDKKYAGALGVFSQLCDKRRGANKLEDSLKGILDDLGKELNDNGGFVGATLDDFNKAIDDFGASGKNKGGTNLTKIVFKGGVLQLKTALGTGASVPPNTVIQGIDITITIPAGVSFSFDAATGATADGVVVPSSKAATGSLSSAKFDAVAKTLHIVIINVQPGFDIGEFCHVEFTGAPPAPDSFTVTVNKIQGGSKTDVNAALIDLSSGTINITKTVAGL